MGLSEQNIMQKWQAWMHLLLNQRGVRSWRTGMQNEMLAWPGRLVLLSALLPYRHYLAKKCKQCLYWYFSFSFWLHKSFDNVLSFVRVEMSHNDPLMVIRIVLSCDVCIFIALCLWESSISPFINHFLCLLNLGFLIPTKLSNCCDTVVYHMTLRCHPM